MQLCAPASRNGGCGGERRPLARHPPARHDHRPMLGVATGALLLPAAGVMTPVFGAIGIIAAARLLRGSGLLHASRDRRVRIPHDVRRRDGRRRLLCAGRADARPSRHREIVTAALPFNAFVIGLPLGAIINDVMLVDDLSDITVDRAKGWRTRPVSWGCGPGAARVHRVAGGGVRAARAPSGSGAASASRRGSCCRSRRSPLAARPCGKLYATAPADVEPLKSRRTAALGLLFSALLSAGIVLSR